MLPEHSCGFCSKFILLRFFNGKPSSVCIVFYVLLSLLYIETSFFSFFAKLTLVVRLLFLVKEHCLHEISETVLGNMLQLLHLFLFLNNLQIFVSVILEKSCIMRSVVYLPWLIDYYGVTMLLICKGFFYVNIFFRTSLYFNYRLYVK